MVNTCTARRAETESHAMVLVRDVPSGSVPCERCTVATGRSRGLKSPEKKVSPQRRGLKSPEKRVSPQKGAQETGITGAHSEEEG